MNTIDENTLLDDLHPARFLKVSDLLERWNVKSITVTISRMANEDTIPNARDIDPDTHKPRIVKQPVLYFKTKDGSEFPRGLCLGAKDHIQALKSATGATKVGEVAGKRIAIYVGEFKSRAVLRIDPKPVKAGE